jgi:tetratricopeptide (TPR) repeat protein
MMTKEQFLKEMEWLLKADKTEQAIKQMRKSPFVMDIEVLKVLGNAYVRTAEYDKAMQIFSVFLEQPYEKKDAAWIWFNIAIIFRFQDNPVKGIAIMLKLVNEYPENPVFWLELGNCFFKAEKNDDAEQSYRKALELIDKDADVYNKAQICVEAGFFYKEKGRYPEAASLFEKSLSYLPIYKSALLYLGDAYYEAEINKPAREAYMKAKEYYPDDHHVQDYVAEKLERLGEGE